MKILFVFFLLSSVLSPLAIADEAEPTVPAQVNSPPPRQETPNAPAIPIAPAPTTPAPTDPSTSLATEEVVVVNVTNGLHRSNAKEAIKIIETLDPDRTKALIVQIHCLMDTNWDEINLVMGNLSQLPFPIYAFVDTMAVDAGALLAFAADHIYMAPASILGGSPILGSGNMKAKMESFNLATARAVAMSKGRDPRLVEAIWNEDVEIRWAGQVMSKEGETLMVEAQDSVLLNEEGQPFIARALVDDVYELAEHAGLDAPLRFTNAEDPHAFTQSSTLDRVKTKEEPFTGKIVVIEIGRNDLVNSARFDYMRRMLQRAEREGAQAVVLDLNTPGGLAWHTGELMMRTLGKLDIPTFAYVNPSAVSAGALIALAADHIYMSPVSAIGAAAVVTPFGDLDEDVERKINAILVPLCRSVARSNGHDPLYATKFMVPEKPEGAENRTGGLRVEKQPDGTFRLETEDDEDAGTLLSLAATEATKPWNDAPPLAKGIATSIEDLLQQENLTGEIVVAEPLGFEMLAQWVTRFSALLLLAAFVAAQVELRIPGFGIFGFLSLALFALFFFGHYAAGKLVGFEVLALFVLGVGLIIVEFVFFPGTLIAGVLGFVCVLVALVYSMSDARILPSGELSPWQVDWSSVGLSLWNLSLALGGAVIIGILTARFLPESRLFQRLVLHTAAAPSGSGLRRGHAPATTRTAAPPLDARSAPILQAPSPDPLLGAQGRTLTNLRPTGSALIGDEVIDVITEGQYVGKDSPIVVIAVEGSRVLVRPA